MRLIDILRERGLEIPKVPVVVADEVATMLDSLQPSHSLDETWQAQDYGTVMPIFEQFFVESKTVWRSEVNPHDIERSAYELGLDVETYLMRSKHLVGQSIYRGAMVEVDHIDNYPNQLSAHFNEATQLLVQFTAYHFQADQVLAPPCFAYVPLDQDGMITRDMTETIVVYEEGVAPDDRMTHLTTNTIPFILKVINLMHQRTVVERKGPTRQQRRAAERKGKPLPSEYYWLKVEKSRRADEPMDLDHISPVKGKRGESRVHFTRGHFRHYPNGLFNKPELAGTYWIPAHEKGKGERLDKGYWVNSD